MSESENKWTPGPWRPGERPAWDATAQIDMWPIEYGEPDFEDGTQPCVAFAFKQADARLIAAAPRLLEALKNILPLLGGWREVIAEIDDLSKHEALAKAMYACLDQIDTMKVSLRAAIAKAQGQP